MRQRFELNHHRNRGTRKQNQAPNQAPEPALRRPKDTPKAFCPRANDLGRHNVRPTTVQNLTRGPKTARQAHDRGTHDSSAHNKLPRQELHPNETINTYDTTSTRQQGLQFRQRLTADPVWDRTHSQVAVQAPPKAIKVRPFTPSGKLHDRVEVNTTVHSHLSASRLA